MDKPPTTFTGSPPSTGMVHRSRVLPELESGITRAARYAPSGLLAFSTRLLVSNSRDMGLAIFDFRLGARGWGSCMNTTAILRVARLFSRSTSIWTSAVLRGIDELRG